ncbi:hypothetical protein ACHQM5_029287 [Ranunculus cassubicifolius]
MKEESQYLNKHSHTNNRSLNIEHESQRQQMNERPFDKRRLCYIATVIILLVIIVIIIVLSLTVFKAKDAKITLTSTKLSGVAPHVTLLSATIELNITFDLVFHVYNPNYAEFSHDLGYSQVYYLQDQVGEVEIAPGMIESRGSEDMKARMVLEAEKVDMSSLVKDVVGGNLRFEIRTRVPGRAKILGFVKKHIVAVSSCVIDVELPSMNVTKQDCKRKTKL